MKLRQDDSLKFHYGVAFEPRLLCGDLVYGEKTGVVTYDLKYFGNRTLMGEYSISEPLERLIVSILDLDSKSGVKESYHGGWDDAGSSQLIFRGSDRIISVDVIEFVDRELLETDGEKLVFQLIDELGTLVNTIYSEKIENA